MTAAATRREEDEQRNRGRRRYEWTSRYCSTITAWTSSSVDSGDARTEMEMESGAGVIRKWSEERKVPVHCKLGCTAVEARLLAC